MDIETITQNNKIVPYLICAYNGIDYITSFSKNQSELFTNFITSLTGLFYKKSNKLIVYAHNLSGFDGVLLMRYLMSFGKVEPLLHNGRLISIKIKLNTVGNVGKTIIFKNETFFKFITSNDFKFIFMFNCIIHFCRVNPSFPLT